MMNSGAAGDSSGAEERLLWIAPALNSYKLKYLNRLVGRGRLAITVVCGQLLNEHGHQQTAVEARFQMLEVDADYHNFQYRLAAYAGVLRALRRERYDYVMQPAELKFTGMILFLFLLKWRFQFQLITYTHPVIGSSAPPWLSRMMTRWVFRLYDRVIFYTEKSRQRVVDAGLLNPSRAFGANNTIDTEEIDRLYRFEVLRDLPKRMLFIGRLVPYKDLVSLFRYYAKLRDHGVGLVIIGDGPDRQLVEQARLRFPEVEWLGAIEDERLIAEQMRRTHLVFIPGHSGLSIVHSFCYGKPYVTLGNRHHPPEIDYLEDDVNGLLLAGDLSSDITRILRLLEDGDAYERVCRQAFETSRYLSVDNWCRQIEAALC